VGGSARGRGVQLGHVGKRGHEVGRQWPRAGEGGQRQEGPARHMSLGRACTLQERWAPIGGAWHRGMQLTSGSDPKRERGELMSGPHQKKENN
jgi:hypothetical protein